MKILVIDNYDSFTYNLVQLVGTNSVNQTVLRNDEVDENVIKDLNPDKIIISPGPGRPEDSKGSLIAIEKFGEKIPVLGVCLGHQAIGLMYGGKIAHAPKLMHGKTSFIKHDGKTIYKNIPQDFEATRYHSLIIDNDSLPDELEVTSYTDDGVIMGVRHKKYPVEGIQYHPESILTDEGKNIIKNWLEL